VKLSPKYASVAQTMLNKILFGSDDY